MQKNKRGILMRTKMVNIFGKMKAHVTCHKLDEKKSALFERMKERERVP